MLVEFYLVVTILLLAISGSIAYYDFREAKLDPNVDKRELYIGWGQMVALSIFWFPALLLLTGLIIYASRAKGSK